MVNNDNVIHTRARHNADKHSCLVNLFVIRSEREVKDLKEKFLRGKGTPNLVSG